MKPVLLSQLGRVHDDEIKDGCEDLARIRRMDAPMRHINGKHVLVHKLQPCTDCFTPDQWKELIARG